MQILHTVPLLIVVVGLALKDRGRPRTLKGLAERNDGSLRERPQAAVPAMRL